MFHTRGLSNTIKGGLLFCLLAALVAAQDTSRLPLEATESRFVRQLDKYENFVDNGLASASSTKQRRTGRINDDPRVSYSYFFAATFKNNGDKEVTALEWDYVITDKKDAQHEILRVTIRSEEKIAPGRKRSLESRERRGLDHIWRVRKSGVASVIVTRLEYADGSLWEAGKTVPVSKKEEGKR